MYDVLVIGSGPAGLAAAVYAKRDQLDTVICEKDYLGTGQISRGVRVDNYPGFPGLSGYELGERFRRHAEDMKIPFCTGEVTRLLPTGDGWKAYLKSGKILQARTVIYAAGTEPRKLGLDGEEKLFGRGVSSCAVCDGMFFRDRTAAVVGGGDTALDTAMFLSEICRRVYLIHRREDFRGNEVTLGRLEENDRVEIVKNATVRSLEGEDFLTALLLTNGRKLKVDGLFEAVGSAPRTDILKGLIPLDSEGYIIAGEDGETSVGGFFAAGDVRTKRLRQVSTAVSDGANAACSAACYLRSK